MTELPSRAATSRRSPFRWALPLVLTAVLIAVGAAVGLLVSLHIQAQQLIGPTISGNAKAADFTLKDSNGHTISLAALKGKVVALTFLYTHCPDVCPLIAGKLAQADNALGSDQSKVELLAVSVDPKGDTPQTVAAFDQTHGLVQPNWHYLLGTESQLIPVWKSYYVGADAAEAPSKAGSVSKPSPQLVDHTAIVYVIDPQGHLRLAFDASFSVGDFVHDVRALES
ncbi:MAG: SCO family protein [Chloroflexi bacterium]|nr:SCO family protein [Chloroflexota bacterium]